MYTVIENRVGKLEVAFFDLEPLTYMKVIAYRDDTKYSASFRLKQQLEGEQLEEVEELLRASRIPVEWAPWIFGLMAARSLLVCPSDDVIETYASHEEPDPLLNQHFFFCPDCRKDFFEEMAMQHDYDE